MGEIKLVYVIHRVDILFWKAEMMLKKRLKMALVTKFPIKHFA
jgi:hypothetical protein